MDEARCRLCGAGEDERPLLQARFEGKEVRFCPKCMPSLIHGMGSQELAELLRREAPAQG